MVLRPGEDPVVVETRPASLERMLVLVVVVDIVGVEVEVEGRR